ncbi:hypothetical protein CC1G_13467 [Coprinopsis cinerea okayama7|uniref:F-box domain-containing protein n=1 Tax=Coprinopsis cinerea (strain Okayama-7 / 130 / ATCC MYA-4618 / FGSC 9003) TaxID=240176 RepID=A8P2P7_COPC7|nr:hypothetical protein CC1G_13467 [Coprinopsis cinerea okayama7\|eukprot:XP_001838378.1 hypothetical protein CC1G_13467 [Coprinopsis cinerea okayama7\
MTFHWSNHPAPHSWLSGAGKNAERLRGLAGAKGEKVLDNNELLSRVFSHVGWRDLGVIGGVCVRFRIIAQDTARFRIRATLEPLATRLGFDVDWLLKAVGKRGGGVIGATALKVMTWGEKWDEGYTPVKRMTLAIPIGEMDKLVNELAKMDLKEWKQVDVYRATKNMVRRVIEFKAGKDEEATYLRIVESTGGVMRAVVASDTTEDMVVVSASRIYLVYPKLAHQFLALKGRWNRVRNDVARKGPTVQASNQAWGFDCGKLCPASWRKGDEGSGIGVFYWNGEKEREVFGRWWEKVEEPGDQLSIEESWSWSQLAYGWRGFRALAELDKDALLGGDVFKWRLSTSCDNPGCIRHPRLLFSRDVGVQATQD